MVDEVFVSLGLDKHEWVEGIRRGESSLASFLARIEGSINEREGKQFEEGLNSKDTYKRFGKEVEFKRYLHGVGDAGTGLVFKFRSGTHGLNEELGRHRGREGKSKCVLCGDEYESVVHVLWECSAYSNIRVIFVEKLQELLGNRYADFDREEQIVRICLYVYVCVAPPMIVGAWSMAIVLWQLYEYYYYY